MTIFYNALVTIKQHKKIYNFSICSPVRVYFLWLLSMFIMYCEHKNRLLVILILKQHIVILLNNNPNILSFFSKSFCQISNQNANQVFKALYDSFLGKYHLVLSSICSEEFIVSFNFPYYLPIIFWIHRMVKSWEQQVQDEEI